MSSRPAGPYTGIGKTGSGAEPRPGQRLCAGRRRRLAPANIVLAEAGTGMGLGYLAPASLWAGGRRGVDLDLYQGAATPARCRNAAHGRSRRRSTSARGKVVVRKGRENYLCLLNLEDALAGRLHRPRRDPRAARRALGGLQPGRRHDRRRSARLARHPVPPARGRRRSPTGAANASMPAARTTANASSSAPCAAAPRPISSSPTMRW
jgi:Rad3-related DNA helicase